MKKNYKRRVFVLDKVPYILFGAILIIAIIIFLPVRSCMPLNFFSGVQEETEKESEYSLFIASPTNDKVFPFINQNETVPVEIKAKEVENTDYTIKLLVNDSEIKSFTSPPYEYNWNPGSSGEYEMIAQLIDAGGNIITNSNTVSFTVQYEIEPEENIVLSVDIEEKKNEILSQSLFRAQNTIPTGVPLFSYKCYIPPVIDGIFQEWDKFEKFSAFEPTVKKENYTTYTDVSGTFYSCWDDDNFYFVVQVVDDVFNQKYTGNQLNKGDSITIVFDTELEEDMQISFYSGDDYRIDFSPGNFSDILPEAFMSWPLSNAPLRGVTVFPIKLTNGYLLEASIPWYYFPNYNPNDEDVLGFTVSIFDTDNLESTELVISSSKVFEFNNVSTLGAIALIDAGDIQSTEEEVEE
ncbi:MAG: sugar-binding protein [Candidatus Hydromicrobium sp.]|nr:sugar-binding protein [Candidatus Hydromicrobium sp.]